MNRFLAALSLASVNTLLLGQASNPGRTDLPARNPLVERADRMSKSFPPEIVVKELPGPGLARSYCATPALDTRTVSFRPCPKPARKVVVVPAKAPEKMPRHIH